MANVTQEEVLKLMNDDQMFPSSNDNAMIKLTQSTHAPYGWEVKAKAFLEIVEDIFNYATLGIPDILQGTKFSYKICCNLRLQPYLTFSVRSFNTFLGLTTFILPVWSFFYRLFCSLRAS